MAATASYDGQIVVWSLETGRIFNQFNVNDVKGNKKYQGMAGEIAGKIDFRCDIF